MAANARGAAFRDTRFPPLARSELPDTGIEVSLLSPLEPLAVKAEAELLGLLRPGVDGLVLSWAAAAAPSSRRCGSSCPSRRDFLAHLKQKAGLPPDWLDRGMRLSRFTVDPLPGRRSAWEAPGEAMDDSSIPPAGGTVSADGRIQCDLCPRDCKLHEGQRGFCFVRQRGRRAWCSPPTGAPPASASIPSRRSR